MADGEFFKPNGRKALLIATLVILTLAAGKVLFLPSKRSNRCVQFLAKNKISTRATYTFGTNQCVYFYKGVPMAKQSVGKFLIWLNMNSPRPLFRDLSVFRGIVNSRKPALFVYVWHKDRAIPPPLLVVSLLSPSGQIILAESCPDLGASKTYLFHKQLPNNTAGFSIQIADGPQPLASIKLGP